MSDRIEGTSVRQILQNMIGTYAKSKVSHRCYKNVIQTRSFKSSPTRYKMSCIRHTEKKTSVIYLLIYLFFILFYFNNDNTYNTYYLTYSTKNIYYTYYNTIPVHKLQYYTNIYNTFNTHNEVSFLKESVVK